MSAYTVTAVSAETRKYDTQFGQMISYKLKLEGVDGVVELGQKTTTPAPQQGQVLNGHVETTQYGLKFKKEQAQGFGGGGGFTQPQPSASPGTTSSGSSKSSGFSNNDPFTMYLSYAKDIYVAQEAAGTFDLDHFAQALEEVIIGGETLYNGRPGAEPSRTSGPTDQDHIDAINLFGKEPDDDAPIPLDQIPF